MHSRFFPATALALSVLALAACGGGDDDNEPAPTALSAGMTVSSASDAVLNGGYSSTNVSLNEVEKVNPIGGEPETCRFRFSGLQQAGTTRLMDGDIRYIPGTSDLRATFVSINGVEFRLQGTNNAAVDRVNGRVVYNGAQMTSTQGSGGVIIVTGTIPMLGGRPEGC
jgi:hypothetical protein